MIEIRNNRGELAELYPGTSISIEKNNPLFTDNDKFFEDITYSFKMPDSDVNKIFFNSGHLAEAKNNVYELPVQCVVAGFPFFAGSIRYRFIQDDFDALLKINLGSLYEQIKNVYLTDIYTNDAPVEEITAAFMKTVAQNPALYPFSFFPIKNTNWDGVGAFHYQFVNSWNHAAQTFDYFYTFDVSGTPPPFTGQSAYFKLKYILQKLADYLGLKAEGSFIDDPDTDLIYVYNRILITNYLFDSSFYSPRGYTIENFFKLLKNDPRIKISISFDVFKGTIKFESASAQLRSNDVLDLRAYISNITDIATPEVNGYSVSLKPDATDVMFVDPLDESKHVATDVLVIGGGEKPIEVETSTLKKIVLADDRSCPEARQKLFGILSIASLEKASIRFVKYGGMKAVAGSKIFPEATPIELEIKDAEWYRFLNDSKPIKASGAIPLNILSTIESSKKIWFLSKEGFNIIALCEKIQYNLLDEDVEFVEAVFTCRIIVTDYETTVVKEQTSTEVAGLNFGFKAYFDEFSGLSQVKIDMFWPIGTKMQQSDSPGYYFLATDITHSDIIKKSTDKGRGNGDLIYLHRELIFTESFPNVEIRVYAEPKYLIYLGKQVLFTQHASGYFFAKPFTPDTVGKYDSTPIWIVF